MRVFLTWSGERSRRIAQELRTWLRLVLNSLEPWMSKEDIAKGSLWTSELVSALGESAFGIVCVTPENQDSPWIHFEAGAVAKAVGSPARVSALLLGMGTSDVTGPLAIFQNTPARREDIELLVRSLNDAAGAEGLDQDLLLRAFEAHWPALDKKLQDVVSGTAKSPATRRMADVLEEILHLARAQNRMLGQFEGYAAGRTRQTRQVTLAESTPRKVPRKGDIYMVDFNPATWLEQRVSRPGVIVSNNIGNAHSSVVIVAAIIRTISSKQYPFALYLPPNAPLPLEGTVLCNQLVTVAKERLEEYRGRLSDVQMPELDRALQVSLALSTLREEG